MNPMDFFDCTKKIEKIKLFRGARKEYFWKNAESSAANSFRGSMETIATIDSGTEYAEEYIRKEESQLLQAAQLYQANENLYDDVSLATASAQEQVVDEEISRIYKIYNFSHHSKVNLTIQPIRDKIIETIKAEPVTIIQGPTGCGKTTQVPQYIMEHCYEEKRPCNIIVTQPRRIAAISIARRVCEERRWTLGGFVGYRVGLSTCTSDDTRLTYCTTGVLLQKLITAKHLGEFTHIIVDEVHERDQDMDFLLLVIRKLLRTNSRQTKIILMSATFNVVKFSKYFSSYVGTTLTPAPIVDVVKQNFYTVSEFFLDGINGLGQRPAIKFEEPEVSEETMKFCIGLILLFDRIDSGDAIDDEVNRSAVLIFLPGIHEIEEMYNLLSSEKHADDKWDIVVLHSSITTEEQAKIFEAPADGYRRIILSTNIAESSITVPDVKYVIDFCLTKQLVTDPVTNYQCLELSWASKANCQQRAGRTGRVMDGRVYRVVYQKLYDRFADENPPEIIRAPLEIVVLRTKMLDMDTPKALLALALDPPNLSNLERTILLLKEAGGLLNLDNDNCNGELTDLGRVMGQLPCDIHISKMIVLGHVFSVFRESIIIGASMAVKNMFSSGFQRKLEAYSTKISWAHSISSDPGAFLHAYTVWMREKMAGRLKTGVAERAWARRHFLQIRVLREVDALVKELTSRLAGLGIKDTVGINKVKWENSERMFILKVVFAGGFYPNYFMTRPENDDTSKVKILDGMDPMKTVYLHGWPSNQPGMLYAERFREIFRSCITSPAANIKVKFNNTTRVYIQFSDGVIDDKEYDDSQGDVSLAVYRALKIRQVGKKIAIPVLPPHQSREQAEELGLAADRPVFFTTLESDESQEPEENKVRPVLPGLITNKVPIFITRQIDPGHFWACAKDVDACHNLVLLEEQISKLDLKSLKGFQSSPDIGTLLLAPRDLKGTAKLQRAVVQGITKGIKNSTVLHVFFIDSGDVIQRLSLAAVRQIPEDTAIDKIPALAFECTLCNIRPCITLAEGWSTDAKKTFNSVTKGAKALSVTIYSVVDSVVNVQLNAENENEETIVINELLISKGYAEFREEDYMSKYNHEIRKQAQTQSISAGEVSRHEAMQHKSNMGEEKYVEPPKPEKCENYISMKGPFSPLEVELTSLVTAGISRKVKVSDTSVNSVLLDSTLVNPKPRLLIAGTVSQAPSSHNLTLYNTTLMPSIPGLPALLCLIFAPQIELRRNSFKTQYTGALCGLGYDKVTSRSLFPEHDMVVDFDVEITLADLGDINNLRHWMTTSIFVGEEEAEDTVICQNQVKEIFFKILDKLRKPIRHERDPHCRSWCRYPQELLLKPGPIARDQNIFKLHHGLDLEERNEVRESLIYHLDELRVMAAQNITDSHVTSIECKLCNHKMFGIFQLRYHIYDKDHRAKENELRLN